jgi:hypothetical protein
MDTYVSEEQADTIFRFKVSRVRIWPGYKEGGKGRERKFSYRPTGVLSRK